MPGKTASRQVYFSLKRSFALLYEERKRKVSTDNPQLDWQDWMHRYDQQQSTYLPDREKRYFLNTLWHLTWPVVPDQ